MLHKRIKRALKKVFGLTLAPNHLLTAFFFQFLSWSSYTLATIILVENISQIENLPLLFSSTMLAWLVGYLSIITPTGLGIRESTFILLTGNQIGIPQAAVVAVLSRTILIIAEFANLAFWLYLRKKVLRFAN